MGVVVLKRLVCFGVLIGTMGCAGSFLESQYYPYETDGSGQQLSFIWGANLMPSGKVQFTGFADYDINEGAADRVVAHPGLWVQIWKWFGVVGEYRYNSYADDKENIAGGVSVRLSR